MLRILTDIVITLYALVVIRGVLGDTSFASLMVVTLGVWCGWQLGRSWRVQGLWT